MAMLLLWLGLYQLATGSSHSGYSLFTFKARIGYNIARFSFFYSTFSFLRIFSIRGEEMIKKFVNMMG